MEHISYQHYELWSIADWAGDGSNANEFACSVSTSIDFPCTVEFDYDATTADPGDVFRCGFTTSDTQTQLTTSIRMEFRPAGEFFIAEVVNSSEVGRTTDNSLYESSGTYTFELFANTTELTNPSNSTLTHNNTNAQRTDYGFLVFDIFDDDNTNTTFSIDNFKIF